jgi:ethanolamine-phosphate phospho-lyase
MAAPASSVTDSILQQRQKLYGPNAALSYDQPLNIVRGQGCYLYDGSGAEYLDCVNNVTHLGHGDEQVASAVASQLSRVNTNSRYLNGQLTTYCQELTDTLPDPLKVVYLVNSGSEANDLALRIASKAAPAAAAACQYTSSSSSSSLGHHDHVVVMAGAYHGHLSSLIPLSPYKFWGPGGEGKPDWVHVMPSPDTYRGLNLDGTSAARAALAEAAAVGGRVVAFFCESIISCGGQIFLPPGYLSDVYAVMRAAGVLCVADEVQTGFGRVGESFWAFQTHAGVVPDIVTMGKPMGNGFPIGGLVTSPAVAETFAAGGMEYFNTYGGCNAAVAAGRVVLREIRDKHLQERAAAVGRHLLARLLDLKAAYPNQIGDVRSIGLFAGIELVTDPTTKTPAALMAKLLKEGAKARGVLLSSDGPAGNVIKIKPPMVFGREEVDVMVLVMSEVLTELTSAQRLTQLGVLEQQHWQQHTAHIMARYADNEAKLSGLLVKQQQDQEQSLPVPPGSMLLDRISALQKSNSNSSSSCGSLIVADL